MISINLISLSIIVHALRNDIMAEDEKSVFLTRINTRALRDTCADLQKYDELANTSAQLVILLLSIPLMQRAVPALHQLAFPSAMLVTTIDHYVRTQLLSKRGTDAGISTDQKSEFVMLNEQLQLQANGRGALDAFKSLMRFEQALHKVNKVPQLMKVLCSYADDDTVLKFDAKPPAQQDASRQDPVWGNPHASAWSAPPMNGHAPWAPWGFMPGEYQGPGNRFESQPNGVTRNGDNVLAMKNALMHDGLVKRVEQLENTLAELHAALIRQRNDIENLKKSTTA